MDAFIHTPPPPSPPPSPLPPPPRYFVSDLTYLQDYVTVDLLYLQSRLALMRGDILTDDDTIFELAACALQAQHGDFKR